MKRTELTRKLKGFGWYVLRQGGKHEIWTNGKGDTEPVPRSPKIAEYTGKSILAKAKANRGH